MLKRRKKRISPLKWVSGDKTPAKTAITRIFNFGTLNEWKTMVKRYPRNQIKDAVTNPLIGEWTPRGKAFAEALFNRKMSRRALISYDADHPR